VVLQQPKLVERSMTTDLTYGERLNKESVFKVTGENSLGVVLGLGEVLLGVKLSADTLITTEERRIQSGVRSVSTPCAGFLCNHTMTANGILERLCSANCGDANIEVLSANNVVTFKVATLHKRITLLET
jgi:hypothetical protein